MVLENIYRPGSLVSDQRLKPLDRPFDMGPHRSVLLVKEPERWSADDGILVFFAAYTILALITNIFHCKPISGTWDSLIESTCYPTSMYIGFALSNSGKKTPALPASFYDLAPDNVSD